MSRNGYIKLHRKVEFCEAIGTDWFLAGAWNAVLLKACYSASTYRGQPVERGEFGYTFRELSSQWEKSHNTIRKVFDHFEKHGMIRRVEKNGVSFVVVSNFRIYQSDSVSRGDTEDPLSVSRDDTQERASVSRGDTERDTQSDTQRDTLNKKDKKVKKSSCAELCSAPADDLSEFQFPTKGKAGRTWTLPRLKLDEYQAAYPDLDVTAEMRKARQWCRDNPTRQKTAGAGILRFLTNWLNTAQNSNGKHKANGTGKGRLATDAELQAEGWTVIGGGDDD